MYFIVVEQVPQPANPPLPSGWGGGGPHAQPSSGVGQRTVPCADWGREGQDSQQSAQLLNMRGMSSTLFFLALIFDRVQQVFAGKAAINSVSARSSGCWLMPISHRRTISC